MRFEGRVALVTGAASGIGRAVAIRLTGEGARVAVADIDSDAAIAAADELTGALAVTMDVADVASVAAAVDECRERLGDPAILVNAAGWDRITRFEETDPSDWDRVLGVNLRGPMTVAHRVLPAMISAGGGSIVNVSSDAGRVGSSGEVVYSAAKGGVIAFTKALAREVARYHIRVNSVAPGPTDTPFLDIYGPDSVKILDAIVRQTPLRRLASADDVAASVCFLASDDADHITGQTLSVSGGLTMV